MQLTEEYIGHSGVRYIFEYEDCDSFDDLDTSKCRQTYGVCFYRDEIVIGLGAKAQTWGLIGGTVEEGGSLEETLVREIKEESNMKVLSCKPIGYQKMIDTRDGSYIFQLRYACAVESYGPFEIDPAGGVTEIKLIDPNEYKQYFDWGEIGERIMQRALELKHALL